MLFRAVQSTTKSTIGPLDERQTVHIESMHLLVQKLDR